jgi:transcriptional regulator with XRE-family HTH domain
MTAPQRSHSLATAVSDRMAELGLDQRALAVRSGVAPSTIRDLQQGHVRDYRPATLAKLSRALEWPAEALIRLISSLPQPRAAASGVDPSYERPRLVETDVLDRLTEMEAELQVLRQLVARSIAVGDDPGRRSA